MPSYDYHCSRCGSFTLNRPLAEFALPQPCPTCGGETPRDLLSAPAVHGGRAASEPRFPCGSERCEANLSMPGAGCGHCLGQAFGA